MKILFLCGSLEPGYDGVGDYVRRLAGELLNKGHQISAIALNDQYIREVFFDNQVAENVSIIVLRLPSIYKTNKRFAHAEQWVNEFNPEWVSLQFVPFAFHEKGLPYALGRELFYLCRGRRWHIMFHELWVGMEREASIKHRILGKAQQFLIKSLIHQLRPRSIHTQTCLYQVQLANLGANAHSLPLFGNIPVANTDSNNAIAQQQISFVLFGNIHHSPLLQQFTDEVVEYAQSTGISIVLILIGRCGLESEHWVAAWRAAGLGIEVLGEQSPSYISSILRKATFGLSTTPVALIEKSGTVAAMQEHGLRVICVGRPWHPRTEFYFKKPVGMAIYSSGNFKVCIQPTPVYIPNENTVSSIAKKLLDHLTSSN